MINKTLKRARHLLAGDKAEATACAYLKQQGLRLIEKNCRSPHGEIDLIMDDSGIVVFVEVRYRKLTNYGLAQETVNLSKQKKVIKSAQWYLQQYPGMANRVCRFDVVAISGNEDNCDISWIDNAFC